MNDNSIILDLGSHNGEFAKIISEEHNCMCYAVEAHPLYFEKIQENDRVKKYNYAISGNNGEIFLYLSQNPEAHSILKSEFDNQQKIKITSITLENFIDQVKIKNIDILKIDIEGAEIALFDSTQSSIIKGIKQITVEFHDFIESFKLKRDVERVIKYLKQLGFYCINFSPHGHYDILFINHDFYSSFDYLFMKYFSKNIERIYRKLKQQYFEFNNA